MDPDALAIAKENVESQEMEDEITFLHRQIAASAETATSTDVDLFIPDAPELTEELEEEGEDGKVKKRRRKIETVVMNPPFGSWNKGIDMVFLETACKVGVSTDAARAASLTYRRPQIAGTAVYSLNKSSTREFIERKAKQFGFEGEVIAEMRVSAVYDAVVEVLSAFSPFKRAPADLGAPSSPQFDLPKTMAFHKKASVDIQVDMWRFVRVSGTPA